MSRQKQNKVRSATFFARVQPHHKRWIYEQMRREGFESMSLWFDDLISKMKIHVKDGFHHTTLGKEALAAKKKGSFN